MKLLLLPFSVDLYRAATLIHLRRDIDSTYFTDSCTHYLSWYAKMESVISKSRYYSVQCDVCGISLHHCMWWLKDSLFEQVFSLAYFEHDRDGWIRVFEQVKQEKTHT